MRSTSLAQQKNVNSPAQQTMETVIQSRVQLHKHYCSRIKINSTELDSTIVYTLLLQELRLTLEQCELLMDKIANTNTAGQ